MIVFWVGAGAGLLTGWACGWAVTSWWRDRHDQADEEYAEELADYPHVDAHEPDDDRCISCGAEIDHYLGCPDDPNPDSDQLDMLAAEMERRLVPAPPALAPWVQDVLGHQSVDDLLDSIVRKVMA